ncbi:MAG: lipopolysaccharide biosynthesis protein [Steroidobacteraceae bacterium]
MTHDSVGVSNVSSTVAARICVLVCGLITGIASARALGPVGRGQYFAVTTLSAMIAQTVNFGLTSSNVFLGARDSRRLWPLLMNSVYLACGLVLISAATVALGGVRLGAVIGVPSEMIWAVCLIGPAMLLWNLAASLLVAEQRFHALNLWQAANAVITLAAIVACARWGTGPSAFVFAVAICATGMAIGLCAFIARNKHGSMRFSWELVHIGVGFSIRAYLALLFGYLLQRAGASMLAAHGRPDALGQYSIASQMFDVLVIIPGSVSTVLYPLLVQRPEDSWPHVRRTALYTTLTMLGACVGTSLVCPWIIPFVFGARFAASVPVLWALLPAVLSYSVVSVLSQYLAARAFPTSLILIWAAGLLAAVCIGVPLTRVYGGIGAAMGQSFGAVLVCVAVAILVWRRLAGGERRAYA